MTKSPAGFELAGCFLCISGDFDARGCPKGGECAAAEPRSGQSFEISLRANSAYILPMNSAPFSVG